jgi:hypothetical protein
MISWQSRKQSSIALSTAEAKYIATYSASCEAIWLRKLLTGLFDLEMRATVILCDNQSCIKMIENPVFHDRSKHIETRYHFIRDMVQRGALKLQYFSTNEQVVDVLTVIHQVAQAGFPEEPPKNEQAVLIHAEFSDSAGPEKAPFLVFPLL